MLNSSKVAVAFCIPTRKEGKFLLFTSLLEFGVLCVLYFGHCIRRLIVFHCFHQHFPIIHVGDYLSICLRVIFRSLVWCMLKSDQYLLIIYKRGYTWMYTMWVLGTKLWSSVRTAHDFNNHLTIFVALVFAKILKWHVSQGGGSIRRILDSGSWASMRFRQGLNRKIQISSKKKHWKTIQCHCLT